MKPSPEFIQLLDKAIDKFQIPIYGGNRCGFCGKEIVMKDKSKRQGIGFMNAYMHKHIASHITKDEITPDSYNSKDDLKGVTR